MKTNRFIALFSGILILAVIFVYAAEKPLAKDHKVIMTEEVKAVVDKSCFGCHNSDSKNEDAKEKLDFKTLDDLSRVKKIGTLRDIEEVLEENEMPPKKFLEKYPDRKLTEKEKEMLKDWAQKEAALLIGQ